jgi:hypothetical protein
MTTRRIITAIRAARDGRRALRGRRLLERQDPHEGPRARRGGSELPGQATGRVPAARPDRRVLEHDEPLRHGRRCAADAGAIGLHPGRNRLPDRLGPGDPAEAARHERRCAGILEPRPRARDRLADARDADVDRPPRGDVRLVEEDLRRTVGVVASEGRSEVVQAPRPWLVCSLPEPVSGLGRRVPGDRRQGGAAPSRREGRRRVRAGHHEGADRLPEGAPHSRVVHRLEDVAGPAEVRPRPEEDPRPAHGGEQPAGADRPDGRPGREGLSRGCSTPASRSSGVRSTR